VTLPKRPDLTRLRDLARAFQRACRAGESEALQRLAAVFPDLPAEGLVLTKAQTVIAREHGLASWPKMKADVEKRRRAKPQKTSALTRKASDVAALVDIEVAEMSAFAERGEPERLLERRLFGRAIGTAARDRIAADPILWAKVVDVLMEGLTHANAKVRYECAHALDTYDDGRAAAALGPLIDDPVPRVRRMAIHALVCDACKSAPAPWSAEICTRVADHLLNDPSVQVRRHAAYEVARCDRRLATATLAKVLEQETDATTLKWARLTLKRLAA
jgi:hypothetical protein